MKWIDLDKKKPEGLGEVLIAYKNIRKDFHISIGIYHSGAIWGHINLRYVKIESSKIYWRKLPKPPKK